MGIIYKEDIANLSCPFEQVVDSLLFIPISIKVKQSRYRPRVAQRVPGS